MVEVSCVNWSDYYCKCYSTFVLREVSPEITPLVFKKETWSTEKDGFVMLQYIHEEVNAGRAKVRTILEGVVDR